jgi:hypothetical protein
MLPIKESMNYIALYIVGAYAFLLLMIAIGSLLVATVANHFRAPSSGCEDGTDDYQGSPNTGRKRVVS